MYPDAEGTCRLCHCKFEHVISCQSAGSGEALCNYSYFKFDHHHANTQAPVPLILYSLYGISQADLFIDHKSVCYHTMYHCATIQCTIVCLVIRYNTCEYHCYTICMHWFCLETANGLLVFLFCQRLDHCCNKFAKHVGTVLHSIMIIFLYNSNPPTFSFCSAHC